MPVNTIRKWYDYNRWANDRLTSIACGLTDDQLDRPFEIGPGSIRAALHHIYGADRIWYRRLQAPGHEALLRSRDLGAIGALQEAAGRLSDLRAAWLDTLDPATLDESVTYKQFEGGTQTDRLGDILFHVCNHGVHHRAQVLNMLRQLGLDAPALDYIAWARQSDGEGG